MLKIGSLCTGYGGLDMAVEAFFDAETVWCSEFDKYASQIIDIRIKKPNLGDLTKIDWTQVEPIDILTAGYPCQPFSHAGSRKGTNDKRHIFPYIAQAIEILRPKYIVLENVRGHLTLGFEEVLATLTELGYDTRWQIIRASDVGAPHKRERLFIIAKSTDPNGVRSELRKPSKKWNQRESQFEPCQCGSLTANAISKRFKNLIQSEESNEFKQICIRNRKFDTRWQMQMRKTPNPLDLGKLNPKFVEYMMGLPEGWVTDTGLPRSQQLKILGNGVVPQQALFALSQIMR